MSGDRPGPPDPAEAGDVADFVQTLVQLKRWAGEPSLSRLRVLGGQAEAPDGTTVDLLPKSTVSHVLRQTAKLPRWDFVRAFVTACLRYCDHPAERIPGELERRRAARTALAAQVPDAAPMATDVFEPGTDRSAVPDPAAELLARRVAKEEDRARKGLLGGYNIAPVSF